MTEVQDIPKHSVHTLVFRSLKRTHDMFLSDYSHPIAFDEKSTALRKNVKALDEYGPVMDLPKATGISKKPVEEVEETPESEDTVYEPTEAEAGGNQAKEASEQSDELRYTMETIENEEEELEKKSYKNFANNSIFGAGKTTHNLPGTGNGNSKALALVGQNQFAVQSYKKTLMSMPKPQWHAPWKLYRVISGHLGWVRCIDVDPSNEWFVTGAGDRIIKIWDLASGQLKLSLTGHVSSVRGVAVSHRHPYLFSVGEDKKVLCWDLEANKVIRHYHGHTQSCTSISLHPTLDLLVSAGRDSVARLWDMRTKAQIHCLEGHTNTVASVKCQEVEPQIITSSHDSTIRCWDIIAGKTMCTMTNHKKSVRALTLHPKWYSMASGAPDNIKQWKFPKCEFIQNLSGHDSIINAMASNSDNVLVSGADNGSIYMWDWLTGYNFQRIQSAAQPGSIDSEMGIFAMTFDQSGSRLLTCEADKSIKIYKEDENATEETHPVNWKPDILKRKRF